MINRRRTLELVGFYCFGTYARDSLSGPAVTGPATTVKQDCRSVSGNSTIEEQFFTPSEGNNLDTPAVWHGADAHLLLVTAKQSDEIVVFDAATGEYLRRIGDGSESDVEFDRPNEIYVVDDLAVVTERDNQRVQVLTLPDGESIGTFGDDYLRRPYGCTAFRSGDWYELFVTDDYSATELSELGERVKHFRFRRSKGKLRAEHVKSFGSTESPGALRKVECLGVDPAHDRLVIADEGRDGSPPAVKLYSLDGTFQQVVSRRFDGQDPEGISLYRCTDRDGLWIFTRQSRPSKFYVYDRKSLEYLATFNGEVTGETDGIWLTQRSFGPFAAGAFYAVDRDRRVAAFDWATITKN